jgi:tetratricopeptide (TPR) repeat protein
MPIRSLTFPDLPMWHIDQNFSPSMRVALTAAYSYIQRTPHTLKNYADAVSAVEPHLGEIMTIHQRIRAYYVMGMAYAAVENYSMALYWLDEALELAYSLHDYSELLDLLYLQGNVSRARLRYRDAALAYRDYLELVDEYEEAQETHDKVLALDALVQLAGAEFFLAHYDSAGKLLNQARDVLPPLPPLVDNPELYLVAATIEWFQSQLYRWGGQPERALRPALTAGTLYTKLGSPVSAARSQLVIAEIQLDIATRESFPNRQHALALQAQPFVNMAMTLLSTAGDEIGDVLISLTDVRLSRLLRRQEDRIARLETIATMGLRLDDEAILGQAMTALGDELAARGEREDALYRYRDVRHMLDGSDIPALGIWALRAAHRIGDLGERE